MADCLLFCQIYFQSCSQSEQCSMQARAYDVVIAQIMGATVSGGRQDWQAGCLGMSRGLYLSPRVSSWLCRSLL